MTKRQLIQHFSSPSTWRGIVLILSACGVYLKPEIAEALIAVGLAVSGAIGVLTSDPAPEN